MAAIRNQKPEQGEDQYVLSCLLMVFIAVIIPRRAALINSTFDANKQGHVNNTHCMGMYRRILRRHTAHAQPLGHMVVTAS